MRDAWSRRLARAGALIALVGSSAAGCGQIKAHEVEAFVRQDGRITIVDGSVPPGEALIRIKNDSRDEARMVLARVHDGVARLPVDGGIVPVGGTDKPTFDGDGYDVVLKIDDLAPHFARGQTSATMHVHLERGVYVLFSNFPGDYRSGRFAELVVD